MKKLISQAWVKAAVFAAVLMVAKPAGAAVIIFDSFNDSPMGAFNSVNLNGTSPDTNLPGGAWLATGTASERPSDFFIPNPTHFGDPTPTSAVFINGGTGTVSLAGFNSGQLTISAFVAPLNSGGASSLGFSNLAAGSVGFGFYGFNLYNDGNLQLTQNGVQSSLVAYTGGVFNSSATSYLLSFTVDTSTGAVTALSLSGSTADYSSLIGAASFNTTNTAFAALTSNIAGSYDSLTVESVPEPSTWALLGGGLVLLFAARRYRNQKA